MFTFFGKLFTSIAVGVSSFFGIHASAPAVTPLTGTSTQQVVTAAESNEGTSLQVAVPAAKVIPAKTTTTPAPVQTTTQANPPQNATPPQTAVSPPAQETVPTYVAPIAPSVDTAAQERQAKVDSITTECNSQINALNQQILDLKNAYYKQLPGILSSGTSVVAQGNANLLLNNTNQKIAQIDLQIQQIQLDCQNKLNQL
jgi:hypothetical protein